MKLTCERVGGFKSAFLFYNIMEEIWKDVVGYEGRYAVSNTGKVKRADVDKIMKFSVNKKGYLKVALSTRGALKSCAVHRIVAFAFLENPENKPEVNHINGVKMENNVENLEWCTRDENIAHAIKTGLRDYKSMTGEKSHLSKLTEKEVREIRLLRSGTKLTLLKIARKYNVTKDAIYDIVHFRSWKHVTTN